MNKAKEKAIEYLRNYKVTKKEVIERFPNDMEYSLPINIRNAIDIAIEETAKEIIKIINQSYYGNELCSKCDEWFKIWIKELSDEWHKEFMAKI